MIRRPTRLGPGRVPLALFLFVLAGAATALVNVPLAAAATREITVNAQYDAPTCPPGGLAMHPIPGAKLIVNFDGHTIRTHLDQQGHALVTLKGQGTKLRATVVLDGEQLAVSHYGDDKPYAFADTIKLSTKKSYELDVEGPSEDAGAASAWAILDQGATLAERSMPSGVTLPKVVARYDQDRGPTGGLPDVDGTETAYSDNQIFIDSRTRADEFEPWVLLHEYGHHVLRYVADPGPTATGQHDLERSYPDQPAVPWSEGFAHAFAAIALGKPVLGTLCRTNVNLASSPATPHSTDHPWLNQYHEISVAGVLWGLATDLGSGDQQAGLKRLLGAFHFFSVKYGGPRSLREARDALIEAGLEQGSAAKHVQIEQRFWDQGIDWRFYLQVLPDDPRTAGSLVQSELQVISTGPYGTCNSTTDLALPTLLTGMAPWEPSLWIGQVGVEGGLPYVSRDDCLVSGGDGQMPYLNPIGGFWLPFPYLTQQKHRSGTFTVKAKWLCKSAPGATDPRSICTSDRRYQLILMAGTRQTIIDHVSLRAGSTTDLLRFDAMGKECTLVATGEDCRF